ncbi:MAG: 50S ribosomal protein L24 [Defluviitaleaceae bacterium]|nr:50S ribosomal protein L24 [Defluviitaleaceae bacterium]
MAQQKPTKIKTKLRKGDSVKIIAGTDKGKSGKILLINRTKGRVIVEGINYISRHVKSGKSRKNPQGGIIRQEGSVDVSNVMFLHDGKPVRLGYKLEDSGKTNKHGKTVFVKKRVARPSGAIID